MKRLISLLICALILLTSLCIIASAATEYEVNGIEYTVEFEDPTIPEEKKAVITNALIGTDEPGIMTANVWCTIFGHDYKYSSVSVIEHKAKTHAPRCKLYTYDVTYCDDCDYTEQKLLGASYINCCPED